MSITVNNVTIFDSPIKAEIKGIIANEKEYSLLVLVLVNSDSKSRSSDYVTVGIPLSHKNRPNWLNDLILEGHGTDSSQVIKTKIVTET